MDDLISPTQPVLVGLGVASQREDDFREAVEPLQLMLKALRAAGDDSGQPQVLTEIQDIAVPHGRWRYRDPAGALARAVGAHGARSTFAAVGVLQQSLIGEACQRIAAGEIHTAAVVGGDCSYRLLRAGVAGERVVDTALEAVPDRQLNPKEELFHPVESALGLVMPIGLYAIMESAYRARRGLTVAAHRDHLAGLYARFSRIAEANPDAWNRDSLAAEEIREPGPRNPMQAFPYTRRMCSTLNVDQAAALLLCSAARAEALGVPRERWIFPLASSESNHMVPVSARADLTRCPGATLAGRAALDSAGLAIEEVDLLDLYSCFPIAVEAYAEALGIDLQRELTLTGSMAFAGGPWNNYVYQATCRAAVLLRAGGGCHALISSVSGMLTKQAFGLWSREPPRQPFRWLDETAAVSRAQQTVDVVPTYSGTATVAGYTVLYARDQAPYALAVVDTPDQRRALVTSRDPESLERLEAEEWVGREVLVDENVLSLRDLLAS